MPMDRDGKSTSRDVHLPQGAAANVLRIGRVAELSDTALAAINFGPWDLIDLCEVPTNEQWKNESPEALFWLRLASENLRRDKAGMAEAINSIEISDPAALNAMQEAFSKWTFRFRTFLALLETARERLPVVYAEIAQRELSEPN